jgi:hypothetical protein
MMAFPIDNAIFFELFQLWALAAYDARTSDRLVGLLFVSQLTKGL